MGEQAAQMADYTAHIKNQRYPQEREKG
jgi:hypothetical protein